MNSGACHSDKHISRLQIFSGNQLLLINDAHGETGQIIFIFRIKAGHFRSLAANQGSPRLLTAICHTFYDSGNFLRIVLSACNVVQEKQRFPACAGNIIHTHSHTVDSHRIMLIKQKRKLQLRSHAVSSGNQSRLFHPLEAFQGKSP